MADDQIDSFEREARLERERQIEKGYDAAHDNEHGLGHLAALQLMYHNMALTYKALYEEAATKAKAMEYAIQDLEVTRSAGGS